LKYNNKYKQAIPFIICLEQNLTEWGAYGMNCLNQNGLDWSRIDSCANGPEGNKIAFSNLDKI
jgi:hypothetical protein